MKCKMTNIFQNAFSGVQHVIIQITEGDIMPLWDEYGDRELEISLSIPKKKRSKDANAYFWSLLKQLSEKLNTPQMVLYRHYIREVGESEILSMPVKAVAPFERAWTKDHKGRFCEVLESNDRLAFMQVFYGSSDFDSKTMGILIDLLVADCKEQGIDTDTPAERERLLKEWELRYGT